MQPNTGAIDYIDPRTLDINEVIETSGATQIPEVYKTNYTFPIYAQLHHQCCVCFATARQLEIWESKQGMPYRKISEAFIWIHAKKHDGLPLSSGTYNIQGMKAVSQYGYVYSDEWDKSVNLTQEEYAKDDIPQNIKDLALTRKMNYASVQTNSTQDWNKAIYTYGATTCPIVLSKDWWTVNGVYNYDVQDPIGSPKHSLDYGHSMLAVGYDNYDKIIVNSWGQNWSKDGLSKFSTLDYRPHSTAYFFVSRLTPETPKPVQSTLPKVADFIYNPVLVNYGQRNENVRNLQIALRLLGYITKDEFLTGFYGDQTKKAVLEFQRKYMIKYRLEVEKLRGTQVGNKTQLEIKKQLSMLKALINKVNSGSGIPEVLQSSQSPNGVSLRIKGLLVAVIPLLLVLAQFLNIEVSETQIMEIITAVTAFISAAMYLWGLIRSIKVDNNV